MVCKVVMWPTCTHTPHTKKVFNSPTFRDFLVVEVTYFEMSEFHLHFYVVYWRGIQEAKIKIAY